MKPIILDTCAVLWIGNNEKLASTADAALTESLDQNEPLRISPISAWELGMLVSRGRYRLSKDTAVWFQEFMDGSLAKLVALTPDVLISSSFLPGKPPKDPSDRIIVATARQYDYCIMTRDSEILEYAIQGHVNAVAC